MAHDETQTLSTHNAQQSLESAQAGLQVGLRRGTSSRWFSAAVSIWAGSITTLMGFDHPLWFLILLAGAIALPFYKEHKGIWVQEVHSARQFWLVIIPGALAVCAIGFSGIVGWHIYTQLWAPIAAGTLITVSLFWAMTKFGHSESRATV